MIPELKQLRESFPKLKGLIFKGDSANIEDIIRMFSEGINQDMVRNILDYTVPALYGTVFWTSEYVGKIEASVEFGKAIVLIDNIAYYLAYQSPQKNPSSISAPKP